MKQEIYQQLLRNIDLEIKQAEEANESANAYKESDDMKQEGKYDTRAIEAGYLAGAQAKRLEELKLEKRLLESVEIKEFKDSDEVAAGALVELETNGVSQLYFLSNTSGGSMLSVNGKTVMVISVFSPIGDGALSLYVGDSFELETPKETREYLIKSIF